MSIIEKIDGIIGAPLKESYVDPKMAKTFIISIREIVNFYFKEKASVEKPNTTLPTKLESGTVGMMNFSTEGLRGRINIFMTQEFLHVFAIKLFGEEESLDDESEVDVSSEFCNQIMGKIKLRCHEIGVKMSVTLPKVVHSKNPLDYRVKKEPILGITVKVGDALLTLDCSMEKT